MKQIDTTQVVDPSTLQPFTARSLKFLQDAKAEDVAGIIKSIVTSNLGSYSLTVPYVISGCVVSDSNKDVTDGEIFYGGKFYEVTGVNGTTNIAQFILTKTQDATADPLQFTDGTNKNVHDIYKYVATDVASGGDFDATDLVSLYETKIAEQITLASQSTSSATYVDMTGLTYTTPNYGATRKYKLTLIGDGELSAGSGTTSATGAKFQIYNNSDAVSLDIRQYKVEVIFPSGSGDVTTYLPINCSTIVSLGPNKEVKCRMLNEADGVTVKECKFFIEEL